MVFTPCKRIYRLVQRIKISIYDMIVSVSVQTSLWMCRRRVYNHCHSFPNPFNIFIESPRTPSTIINIYKAVREEDPVCDCVRTCFVFS